MAVSSDLEHGTKLVQAWGQLSDAAIFGAVILGVCILASVVAWIYFKYRQHKTIEEGKRERAAQYAAANDRMTNSINKLFAMIKETQTQQTSNIGGIARGLTDIIDKIDKMMSTLRNVHERQEGVINQSSSLQILKTYFFKVVFNDFKTVIHNSLRDNDFRHREQYVTDKVKTRLGVALADSRSALEDYDMAFSSTKFFKLDSSGPGERFMLVDMVWDSIKSLYLDESSLEQRLEEASLKIHNVIMDYFTAIIYNEIEDVSGKYKRTPTNYNI